MQAAAVRYKLNDGDVEDGEKYYYWQIVAHWLAVPDPTVTDERLRGLSKQMALRMLEKTVDNTVKSVVSDPQA